MRCWAAVTGFVLIIALVNPVDETLLPVLTGGDVIVDETENARDRSEAVISISI